MKSEGLIDAVIQRTSNIANLNVTTILPAGLSLISEFWVPVKKRLETMTLRELKRAVIEEPHGLLRDAFTQEMLQKRIRESEVAVEEDRKRLEDLEERRHQESLREDQRSNQLAKVANRIAIGAFAVAVGAVVVSIFALRPQDLESEPKFKQLQQEVLALQSAAKAPASPPTPKAPTTPAAAPVATPVVLKTP